MNVVTKITDLGDKIWELDFELEFERLGKHILNAASVLYMSPPSSFGMATRDVESKTPLLVLNHQNQQLPMSARYPYQHTDVFLSYLVNSELGVTEFAYYSLERHKPTKTIRLHFLEENLNRMYGQELKLKLNKELLPRVIQYFTDLNKLLMLKKH